MLAPVIPAPLARNPRLVVALGDSRIAALFFDPSRRNKGNRSPFHWANALLDQRFTLVDSFGLSGDRTDQMLARLDATIATGAGLLYFQGGVNNIGAVASGGYTYTHAVTGEVVTIDTVAAVTARDIRLIANKARASGMIVVIEHEVGAGGYTTQEKVTALADLRANIADFAENTPDIFVHDAMPIVMQPQYSANAVAYRSGYSYDPTHCSARGAYRWGKSLAKVLAGIVTTARPVLLTNAIETSAARRRQALINPLFANASGGTASAGASGTVPANWTVSRSGSATANVSTAARADASGNDLIIAASYSAAGEIVTVSQAFDAPATGQWNSRLAVGDTYEVVAQVEITDASALSALWLQVTTFAGSGAQTDSYDLYGVTTEAGLDEAATLTLRTRPFAIVTPTSSAYPYVVVYIKSAGTAAGNCTYRIKQIGMKRIGN
ncbi:SGNH/GDSL hydrolase family protein [Sphingomonas sp. NCPPB 2930]|uniref:SGNH/GDSL hydrolase family protein n=1 Tax=Sphingomonas sp. NCPPB 2930 TaxID=3162788 RepID=UPI0036DA6AA9